MRIAIDARWIFREMSGIGVYTRELIRNLAVLDSENRYLLLFDDEVVLERTVAETGIGAAGKFETERLPYGLFSIGNQLRLPTLLRKHGIDVFHSPNYMIPFMAFPRGRSPGAKCVVTVHDVIPMLFPDHAPKSRKTRLYPLYRSLMLQVGARADAIISVSNASRRDVIEQLRIPGSECDKVSAVYNGVSAAFKPPGNRETAESRGADTRTLLYVGRSDPYKNVTLLIELLERLRRNMAVPIRLVIAGSRDARYPEAEQCAARLGLSDAVEWTGALFEAELVERYQKADVLVHPSRYEGFGLQILEAMSCGLPVVCSRGGALPEVAGDAAILLDPDDIGGFVDAARRVLTDGQLAGELAEKGIRRGAEFSWAKTAARTLEVYRRVATL